MRKFIERALAKLNKLDSDQIHALMYDLAYEHERLNGVLDSLSDGIMVADVENNLIVFNKAAERLVPFAGSDGYDRPIWESITDDEISRFVEQTLETQESIRDREFALDRSGMTRLLGGPASIVTSASLFGSVPLDASSGSTWLVSIFKPKSNWMVAMFRISVPSTSPASGLTA